MIDLSRRTHKTYCETAGLFVEVRAVINRIEVEAPHKVRVVGIDRTRPVFAVAANVFYLVAHTVAGGRKEETLSVGRSEQQAVHTVLGSPSIGGVLL